MPLEGRLLMVGCGNMGGAMLARWLASGLDPAQVTVVSPSGRLMPEGVTVVSDVPYNPDDDDPGYDIILLALKPQQLASLKAGHLNAHAPRILISILAGIEETTLAGLTGAGAIVRAMPNLPVAIGKGVVVLNSASARDTVRADVTALMAPLGLVEWVGAEHYDLAGSLSGCGPAFTYRFIDALAAAGTALGLSEDQAERLALATVEGAGLLAATADEPPAKLADRVASPGGSTREGLNVLDRDNALVRLLTETLTASERRTAEMAAAARG